MSLNMHHVKKRFVISFLGMNPEEITYVRPNTWAGEGINEIKTSYVSYAVHHLTQATRTFTICTPESADTFNKMAEQYAPDVRFASSLSPATIADFVMVMKEDHDVEDVFSIISNIITAYNADDIEWVFDITGGFRNIPFIVNTVLEYLSVIHDVRVYDVCYARKYGNSASILSLNLQRTYALWARATDVFVRYGQSDQLVELFARLPPESGGAQDYLNVIGSMVDALYTAQFDQLTKAANDLLAMLDKVRNQPLFLGAYEPLTKLLQHIRTTYAVFVVENDIHLQHHVIRWYIDHRMWAQAIIASHEYLISLSMHYFNDTNKKRKHWENVGMGSFTNSDNDALYVIWDTTQANSINRIRLEHRYRYDSEFSGKYHRTDVSNGIAGTQIRSQVNTIVTSLINESGVRAYRGSLSKSAYFDGWCKQQIEICRLIERYFADSDYTRTQDATVILQHMRMSDEAEWVTHMTNLHRLALVEYADADVALSPHTVLADVDYQPRVIVCFEMLMREVFKGREALLKDVPQGVILYPIGNEIRKARNGVSHMSGVADIHTINDLCERLITMAEAMQRDDIHHRHD